MDAASKELSVLVRHVPRIVVSRFIKKPERLRGPESITFTGVVALFDISGFSSLGSKLSDDERSQINSTQTNSHKMRTSLPLGLMERPTREQPGQTQEAKLQHRNSCYRSSEGSANEDSEAANLAALPRDLMAQRRQSANLLLASESIGQRSVSFISRSKPAAPQGVAVETLTKTLNQTLEPVIDVILQHGGDIIKFAGDAIIVLWETEASLDEVTPPGYLTYSAVRCAMEALQVLESMSIKIRGGSHLSTLGMHVGIGVSQMTGNHVGGVLNRWEFYLGGDANRQMSSAEEDAQKGQIVISREAYKALLDAKDSLDIDLTTIATAKGNYLVQHVSRSSYHRRRRLSNLRPTRELIPFLRGYVPGTISSYLQKGLVLNPCTRNITVVFIKLEGIKEIGDPSEQLEQVQRYLCLIQESAYKVQGTLRQFVIDDKGAVAIIVLGLPPFYHENNVTTGNAFCGSVGSGVRAEYAVVGDVINLAARLMASARIGEIFCDEKTRDETNETIEYQDAKELTVKGKTASVKVYAMQHQQHTQAAGGGDATATRLDAVHALPYGCNPIIEKIPFFGTAASMQRKNTDRRAASGVGDVMAALAHHQDPHRVLIVAGESGTGKTMLLRHLVSRHSRCFLGAGDPVDATMEFHAWCGIVREMTSRTIKMAKPQFGSPDMSFNNYAKDGEDDQERGNGEEHAPGSVLGTSIESALYGMSNAAIGSRMLASVERTFSDTSMASMGTASNTTVLHRTNSGSRSTMEDPSAAYEHMPVLEYLVYKSRIARSMIPILNDLLPYDHLYQGEFRGFDKGEERTKALEHMIFSIVDALSAYKPILLLFDNAQWMDGMSWSLVLKVLEELPNVHCLIATRSQSRAMRQPLFELIEHLPITKRQELRRFSYQVTSLFLCQRFHIAIMDTQVLDFVYARTNGNPAEVIKLMEFMLASKYIAVDRNVGSVTILSDLDDLDMQVPQYTCARVMSCVDGLDSLAQLALKVISINPEPVEERAVSRILNWFITSSDLDESTGGGAHPHHDMGTLKLKVPESDTGLSIGKQVRMGLTECEKEAIVTIDDRRKLFYFNSEEMRLVVYDTMLPSQRETIHSLYCHLYREVTADPLLHPTPGSSPHAMVLPEVVRSINSVLSSTERVSMMHAKPYQQLAMLGYHLARAGDAKAALEAYQKAAEQAIDMKELAFATDCMQSSFKILEDHHQQRGTHHKLNDLDYILLRSRVEFMRGAIAVEKSEWDTAITHMAYIIRLCQRKGSVLRRYSSSVHQDGLFESTPKTSSLTMAIGPSTSIGQRRQSSSVLNTATALHNGLDPRQSLWYLEMQEQCMPRLISFRVFLSWTQRVTAKLALQGSKLTARKQQWSNHGILMRMGSSMRIQPEETLQALHQVIFYRRKAEILIKKILLFKRKQEEMSRDIQKLTQKSLQTKQKR
uniref:Guanylate cyclase domain-containing protein n=1 Tax=Globisporangium ultimum (strain ATCC 200006 / CBS 805.95 / DAOM BR144) TaxID=431595 RepID=K3WME2_GLOUD